MAKRHFQFGVYRAVACILGAISLSQWAKLAILWHSARLNLGATDWRWFLQGANAAVWGLWFFLWGVLLWQRQAQASSGAAWGIFAFSVVAVCVQLATAQADDARARLPFVFAVYATFALIPLIYLGVRHLRGNKITNTES